MFGKTYKETERKHYFYDEHGRVSEEVTTEPAACTLLKAAGFLLLIGAAGAAGYVARGFVGGSDDECGSEEGGAE